MSLATAIKGTPVARAFTNASVQKPRSANARRAPFVVRARGDPAAPDKAEVKDEVIDCRSLLCRPNAQYTYACSLAAIVKLPTVLLFL